MMYAKDFTVSQLPMGKGKNSMKDKQRGLYAKKGSRDARGKLQRRGKG